MAPGWASGYDCVVVGRAIDVAVAGGPVASFWSEEAVCGVTPEAFAALIGLLEYTGIAGIFSLCWGLVVGGTCTEYR